METLAQLCNWLQANSPGSFSVGRQRPAPQLIQREMIEANPFSEFEWAPIGLTAEDAKIMIRGTTLRQRLAYLDAHLADVRVTGGAA